MLIDLNSHSMLVFASKSLDSLLLEILDIHFKFGWIVVFGKDNQFFCLFVNFLSSKSRKHPTILSIDSFSFQVFSYLSNMENAKINGGGGDGKNSPSHHMHECNLVFFCIYLMLVGLMFSLPFTIRKHYNRKMKFCFKAKHSNQLI